MHFFLIIFLSMPLWAHQSSLTSSGKELFWNNKNVPLMIRPHTTDMTASEAREIIRNSIAQWNQSSSANVVESSSSNNQIRFVSNFPYGSAVLGVTEITYNQGGAIQRAVISLNDDYRFHKTPGLYPAGHVFLGDVVTHEIGHLFGLSHSEVLNASMFYSSFSGQSLVSLDDKSGLRNKYDNHFGKISGSVRGGDHVGVLGTHVQAVSRRTGQTSAVISDQDGRFELGGLDLDDTYYLYTSPIRNVASLPGQFSNFQTGFCPGSYVGSFFSACGRSNDGKPQGINLTIESPFVDVGTVTINCRLKSDQDYDYQKLQTNFSPINIYDYSLDAKFEKSFVGWFRKRTNSLWSPADLFRVDLAGFTPGGAQKFLKVSLVSFPFGSQLQYRMTIRHDAGAETVDIMRYSELFETYNPDFERFLPLDTNPNLNHFEISISAKKMENFFLGQVFPDITDFTSDTHMPYLLVTSLWEEYEGGVRPLMSTGSDLSDSSMCLDAPLTYAVAHARTGNNDTVSDALPVAAATCGSIGSPPSGPGPSLPLVLLGFFMTLIPAMLSKTSKKFLS